MNEKPKKGGKRPGSGRPRLYPGARDFTFYCTEAEKDKLKAYLKLIRKPEPSP